METSNKSFIISSVSAESQYVSTSAALGRIMFHPGFDEAIGRFGSVVKRYPGETSVEIVPPIPEEKLKELGQALVELAQNLDSSPPAPIYELYN